MTTFCGDHRPGIAVKKLLAECVLKLVDNARNLRGGKALAARDHGKIFGFKNRDKNLQRTEVHAPGIVHSCISCKGVSCIMAFFS